MFKKTLFAFALLATAVAAQAQSSPAKKELVNRILKLQQPGIEAMARGLAEQPAAELLERAGMALPTRVPADKREAAAKAIDADVKKYLDETVPVVRDRAVKLAPSTIGALLEEKFSEEELKQVVGIIESPVYAKFQQLGGEMQKVLIDKLVADTRGSVEPKVRALEATLSKRLGIEAPAAAATRPPAKAASK